MLSLRWSEGHGFAEEGSLDLDSQSGEVQCVMQVKWQRQRRWVVRDTVKTWAFGELLVEAERRQSL